MTHGAPSQPTAAAPTPRPQRWEPTPVPTLLRWGVHVLVAALLALAAGRGILHRLDHWPWIVAGSVVVGAVYAIGPHSIAVARSSRAAGGWLAVLLVAWVGLLALTPDAIYLAFPWFFLLLHLLPRLPGLVAVAFTTVAAIAGFAWHQRSFTAAMAIGPILGAGVVIATVFGYQALQAESERRRRLIVELDRTRSELATVEHRAGVLNERERLAREIHDTLAQGLSSIQLLLLAAGRSLDADREIDPMKASALVEQARLAAQDNLVEARRFVRALSPRDLEESTLAAALQRLCRTTSERTGIEVTFHEVGPATTLATPVEVALLRIAQAALGNTTQHSRATRADVTLTSMDTAVSLDVVDDGVGFDPDAPIADHSANHSAGDRADDRVDDRAEERADDLGRGGFGLRSMRSRAAELGAVLTVESQPGRGTAVSVHLEREAPDGIPRATPAGRTAR